MPSKQWFQTLVKCDSEILQFSYKSTIQFLLRYLKVNLVLKFLIVSKPVTLIGTGGKRCDLSFQQLRNLTNKCEITIDINIHPLSPIHSGPLLFELQSKLPLLGQAFRLGQVKHPPVIVHVFIHSHGSAHIFEVCELHHGGPSRPSKDLGF